jgi:anti-sigma regulatory factor (Ser/Thr protein kinase)
VEDLSLHILDIAENSIDAGATRIEIKIVINTFDDRLILQIKDNGQGMDDNYMKKIRDPYFTTKTSKRFGLGIPLLAQSAEECKGRVAIESALNRGTTITAEFQQSHIDRKPIGDIGATMMVLIDGHPEINFLLSFERNGFFYEFNSEDIKRELNGTPINLPSVLKLIKDDINEAIKEGL